MTYRVDLAVHVEDGLAALSADGCREAMSTIAAALVRPEAWPAPGVWDTARLFGSRTWITFAAHTDGIEVLNIGCL